MYAFGVPLFIYSLFNGEISFDDNTQIFEDVYSLIIIMIKITISFILSVLLSNRYTMYHVLFFILLFVGFIISVFYLMKFIIIYHPFFY